MSQYVGEILGSAVGVTLLVRPLSVSLVINIIMDSYVLKYTCFGLEIGIMSAFSVET